MASYWDYLQDSFTHPLSTGPASLLHAWWNMEYDNAHGSKRYWLSQMRPFSTVRKLRDSAQSAEDRYNNTGTDEQYISRVGGTDATALLGDVGMGAGVVGMARSLSDVYRPEVVEDVGKKFNGMYR